MNSRLGRGGSLLVAGAVFLTSGAAALVYQVAWQRILALHSGVGLYSVAIIVSAFMAGLGVGSYLGGRWSARVGTNRALLAFAGLEIAIGVFGAFSDRVYYDWLYPFASQIPSPSLAAGLLHFAALLPPTILMGMSLPLIATAAVRSPRFAGRTIGYLYGVNVLGAAIGSFATPWLLLRSAGMHGAVVTAACGNLLAGLGALALWRVVRQSAPARPEMEETATGAAGERHPFALWLALYGVSGFVALSLEILWFRLIDVAVKSTAFTFGSVLALYLLGSALGCLLAVALAEKVRRPLRAFLLCQCAIVLTAALPILLLVRIPVTFPVYEWYHAYWGAYRIFRFGTSLDPVHVVRLYLVLPFVLFAVPTVLMGFSFPVLQRAVHDELRTVGRKVGLLQAANILGCVAGSLFVGIVALQLVGTAATLRALVLLGLVFAGAGLASYGRVFALPALAIVAATIFLPDSDTLWRRLHGTTAAERRAFFEEDATGVVALTPRSADQLRLTVNGKGHSWLPYGGPHTVMGALPALIHPAPLDIGLIGLGSGDTAWAAACRRETRSVTVFEIASPQPVILRRVSPLESLPELAHLLADPRLTIRIADGRQALASQATRYDLLEADATWPHTAYSGNLYSREFFSLCASRLQPGGIMCTWAPTPRVYATFRAVFPFVLEADGGTILVGSREPLAVSLDVWLARLRRAETYLGAHRVGAIAARLRSCQPAATTLDVQPNTDMFPRDEFLSR